MISKHSAHLTPLPFGIRTWLWRYTYLLLLISKLWHRQAIFESKGDTLSSSVECRIRIPRVSETQSPQSADWAIEVKIKIMTIFAEYAFYHTCRDHTVQDDYQRFSVKHFFMHVKYALGWLQLGLLIPITILRSDCISNVLRDYAIHRIYINMLTMWYSFLCTNNLERNSGIYMDSRGQPMCLERVKARMIANTQQRFSVIFAYGFETKQCL